jgi:hypothetical protein
VAETRQSDRPHGSAFHGHPKTDRQTGRQAQPLPSVLYEGQTDKQTDRPTRTAPALRAPQRTDRQADEEIPCPRCSTKDRRKVLAGMGMRKTAARPDGYSERDGPLRTSVFRMKGEPKISMNTSMPKTVAPMPT